MNKVWFAALAAGTAAVGGCDFAGFGGGGGEANGAAAANANAAGANTQLASSAPTDAGVTTSRSLAGLGGGDGGKDPNAGATAASSGSVDPQLLIGRWTDDGDCKRDIEFRPDGTFRSYTGGEGQWNLNGDVLTLSGQGGTFQLRLQALDGDTMMTVNQQGNPGRSTRC